MAIQLGKTYELLKPHAGPRIPALAVSVGLGMLTGGAQAVTLVLIVGLWSLIFPEAGAQLSQTPSTQQDSMDRVFGALESWARDATLFDTFELNMLVALAVIALVLALVAGFAQWGVTLIQRRVAYQMIVDLRVRIARHLMALSMHYHGKRRFGDLLSRVSSDVETTLAAVNVGMKNLIQEPIMALATMAVMVWTAPQPTVGVLVLLPIGLYPVARMTRKVRKGSKKSLTSLGDSAQALTQMFQGVRTVKSFGGEERELDHYRHLNSGYLRQSMKMVRAVAMAHAWAAFFSIGAFAVLVVAIGWIQVRFEPFDGGDKMAAWFVMVARLANNMKSCTKGLSKMEESVGASERIIDLLEEEVDLVEHADPLPVAGLDGPIRFEHVTFRYPAELGEDPNARPALADLDLELRPGETLALVGPSGAGKSTLVDLVARFVDPTEGRVTVNGQDLARLKRADWTALYAMVSQVPFLFHSSIAENIAYGKPGASRAEIEEAARAADIHDFIESLPDGYDTNVSDMGVRLSGGQRQRITIARALLKGAPLLLLDEATSSLDSESEKEVQAALTRLMEDRTVLVIAHRLSTVRNADRIAVLEEGRLVELGTHAELLERGGTYARLYALQNLDSFEFDEAPVEVPRNTPTDTFPSA